MELTKKQKEGLGNVFFCCWILFLGIVFLDVANLVRTINVDPGFKVVSFTILIVGYTIIFLMHMGNKNEIQKSRS